MLTENDKYTLAALRTAVIAIGRHLQGTHALNDQKMYGDRYRELGNALKTLEHVPFDFQCSTKTEDEGFEE